MLEQEIKLFVPPAARAAVRASLAKLPGPRRVRMRAMYFDTVDRGLARQRAAVRLRQEGRQWVQTFKMAGADAVSRLELNHDRPGPELDLSVYAGTPAEAVFAQLQSELILRYETDVMRLVREIRVRRTNIEIAYDVGVVKAGRFSAGIDEIEFERTAGWLDGVFHVAADWSAQHGLVLDARSKAERGDALARAEATVMAAAPEDQGEAEQAELARLGLPVGAEKFALDADVGAPEALARICLAAYDQIVRNAVLIATVPGDAAEHVHQLRVGIRRLRSAWRFFRGWAELPPAAVEEGAKRYFAAFGEARDADVMDGTVLPMLERAGMPPLPRRNDAQPVPATSLVVDPGFQTWMLELLQWISQPPRLPAAAEGTEAAPLVSLAARRLRKWHRELVRDGAGFTALPEEQQHTLRKEAKRLRYALGFVRNLFDADRTKAYLKALSALQDLLGELNDLAVARPHFLTRAHGEPAAWFAVGWIAARSETLATQAEAALIELGKTKPFWKG
ncbi:CHAD domain-containing protein [Achromobacter sp. GG226]|uniref:CYTH and CHAD domain-containing protein n=1 Tax=Verticiella alkaliphila TaxID=2779529 RepID=UPI001C0E6521|nr:CHAD domain-containing protein [Verticiella sp. GG226]MBU4612140.1 CHAD domain-containing protein [Verticiella sp. GG226]